MSSLSTHLITCRRARAINLCTSSNQGFNFQPMTKLAFKVYLSLTPFLILVKRMEIICLPLSFLAIIRMYRLQRPLPVISEIPFNSRGKFQTRPILKSRVQPFRTLPLSLDSFLVQKRLLLVRTLVEIFSE